MGKSVGLDPVRDEDPTSPTTKGGAAIGVEPGRTSPVLNAPPNGWTRPRSVTRRSSQAANRDSVATPGTDYGRSAADRCADRLKGIAHAGRLSGLSSRAAIAFPSRPASTCRAKSRRRPWCATGWWTNFAPPLTDCVVTFNLVWTAYEAAIEVACTASERKQYFGKGARGREVLLRIMENSSL